MLWAIGAWVAAGLIGGFWARRKGHVYGDSLRSIPTEMNVVDKDNSVYTGEGEISPYFAAALSGPFALYNAWKQRRRSS